MKSKWFYKDFLLILVANIIFSIEFNFKLLSTFQILYIITFTLLISLAFLVFFLINNALKRFNISFILKKFILIKFTIIFYFITYYCHWLIKLLFKNVLYVSSSSYLVFFIIMILLIFILEPSESKENSESVDL
jgi:hypothetical protein